MISFSRSDRPAKTTARKALTPHARSEGSLFSVFVGWAACVLGWGVIAILYGLISSEGQFAEAIPRILFFWVYVAGVCGVCVLITWALVFVWVYVYTPRDSRLWKPALCTPLGALAGALTVIVLGIPFGLTPSALLSWQTWMFVISGAVTGGTTCLHASITVHRYHGGTP